MTKRSVGLERLGGGDNFPYLSGQVRNFATCVHCKFTFGSDAFWSFLEKDSFVLRFGGGKPNIVIEYPVCH